MSEPFSPLSFMQQLYGDLSSTLPWPHFDHPHCPPSLLTEKIEIDGRKFLIFEAYDDENAYSTVPSRLPSMDWSMRRQNTTNWLRRRARGGGAAARAAVAATTTVDEAEDVVDGVEFDPEKTCVCEDLDRDLHRAVFLKFLHHDPIRDALLYSGDAEIVACGNDEDDSETCGISYHDFRNLESLPPVFPSTNRLGKALMVAREFFHSVDEEDLIDTRREVFYENEGGEDEYLRRRGIY